VYKDFETRASYRYLKEVIDNLAEPICILGGWAVFFLVNPRFQKAQGRPYIGSRDIDLGFNVHGDLKKSVLAQTIKVLTEQLNFNPLSFRLVKEIHTETEEEIKAGEIVPTHFTFPMYVDLIVDNIPEEFYEVFKFNPIDEPLLRFVFENDESVQMTEFDKKLLLPKPELILAMKIRSIPDRDKEHKRIKDICDIFALLWYSGIVPEKANISRYVSENDVKKCLQTITDADLEKSAVQLGHSREELKKVINLLSR